MFRIIYRGIIGILFSFAIFSVSLAQTVVKIIPSETGPATVGQDIDLDVEIHNYANLHGYTMVILFNKAVVNLKSPAVTKGTIFSSAASEWFTPHTYTDSLKVDHAILLPAAGVVSGTSGLCFTIHFHTIGNGGTDIRLIYTELRDASNGSIPHSKEDAVITVTSPLPDNSYTEPFKWGVDPPEVTFGNSMAKMDFHYTSGGGTVTIMHYETKPPGGNNAPFNPDPVGLIQNPVVGDRYWEVTSSMGNVGSTKYSADIRFSYAGLPGVQAPQWLRVAKRPLSSGATDTWDILNVSEVLVDQVNQEIVILGPLDSELYTEGQYTIISDAGDNALPVELSSFIAKVISENFVRLHWRTESEINNLGFEIERRQGENRPYRRLANGFIAGNGNTNMPHEYSYSDQTVKLGLWYYRLKQIDFDGKVEYLAEISVEVKHYIPISEFRLNQNYPNPFNPTTTIEFEVPKGYEGEITLSVYDNLGREIETLVQEKFHTGHYLKTWNGKDKNDRLVPSGVYYYNLSGTNISLTKKMVFMR